MSTSTQDKGTGTPDTPPKEDKGQQQPPATKPKLFSRNNVPRVVTVVVGLQQIIPDVRFTFKLRLALSEEMQKKREKWLALGSAEIAEQEEREVLDELCDLLVDKPEGFEDWPADDRDPATQLREYVKTTTDPDAKEIVRKILNAADNAYWSKVTPREFPA